METIINYIDRSILLFLLTGFLFCFFREAMDRSMHNKWTGKWSWMNSSTSWKNKWKLDGNGDPIIYIKKRWYYFGFHPAYQERFFLSSTALVWLTDPEHFFQLLSTVSAVIAVLYLDTVAAIAFVIGVSLFSIIKERMEGWQ